MRPRDPRRHRRGLTLIEILIATAILGLMMMIAWSTIKSASNARTTFEAIEDRNHEIRVGLNRLVFDLEHVYLSKNETGTTDNRLAYFIGKDDEVRFSSFGHQTLWADSNESDQTVVAYFLDDDPSARGKDALFRKELRRPSIEMPWDRLPGELDILIGAVDKLEIEYWDWKDKDWQRDWDSTKADGEADRVPTRVRIKLTYANGRGDELTMTTEARLMLEEAPQF